MKNKPLVALVIATAVVFVVVFIRGAIIRWRNRPADRAVKEKYEELQFVVVHRPDVTYFVDFRYLLCFATRKPNYNDLVRFKCPDLLLREAMGGVEYVPEKSKDAGK